MGARISKPRSAWRCAECFVTRNYAFFPYVRPLRTYGVVCEICIYKKEISKSNKYKEVYEERKRNNENYSQVQFPKKCKRCHRSDVSFFDVKKDGKNQNICKVCLYDKKSNKYEEAKKANKS